MRMSDIEKMIAVGLVWGTTNAFMKRGATIHDQKKHKHPPKQSLNPIIMSLQTFLNLMLTWQYSVPLLINLSASATFFALIGRAPISIAVPVTNATTFAATAVVGMGLGEEMRSGFALIGTLVIVFGVCLCVL